jgi:hypothetical protein
MSRSNHYRESFWNPGEKPFREIAGRRNWTRKQRWPKYSLGSFHSRPSRWWWQEQHARARAIYRQLILHSDDPVLPREQDLIDLYGWY